jgi:hypothetical protein
MEAETAFTTFFPRYYITDEKELASYYEKEDEVTGPITQGVKVKPFFDKAKELGIDVQIGYGEDTGSGRYNTAVYVSGKTGEVLNKYRKVGRRPRSYKGKLIFRFTCPEPLSPSTLTRTRQISSRSGTSFLVIWALTPSERHRSRKLQVDLVQSWGNSSATTGDGQRAGGVMVFRGLKSSAAAM